MKACHPDQFHPQLQCFAPSAIEANAYDRLSQEAAIPPVTVPRLYAAGSTQETSRCVWSNSSMPRPAAQQQAADTLQQHIGCGSNSCRRIHPQALHPACGVLLLLVAVLLPVCSVLPAAALKLNLPSAGAATSATPRNSTNASDTSERLHQSVAGSRGYLADAAAGLPTPAAVLQAPGSTQNASLVPADSNRITAESVPAQTHPASSVAAQPLAVQAANASNMTVAVQPLLSASPRQAVQGNLNAAAGASGNTTRLEQVPSSAAAAAVPAAVADQLIVQAADGASLDAEATTATDASTEYSALAPAEEPMAATEPPAEDAGNTTEAVATTAHNTPEEAPGADSAAAASGLARDAAATSLPAAEMPAIAADSTSTTNTPAGSTSEGNTLADFANNPAAAAGSQTKAPAAAASSSTNAPEPGPATDVEVLNAVAARLAAAESTSGSTRVSEPAGLPSPDSTSNTGSTGGTNNSSSTDDTSSTGSAGEATETETAAKTPPAAAPTLPVAPGTVAQVAAAGVPDRCIITGSSLFSACALEIATAQRRFNISVDVLAPQNYTAILRAQGVTRDQAVAAMQQILARPSASCCSAHCRFNQQLLCDCEPSVLDVAVRFAGADVKFYGLLVEQLAAGCGLELFFNDSCPANRTEALVAGTESSLRLLEDNADVHRAEPHVVSAQAGQVIDGFCVFVNGTAAEDGSMPPQAAVDSSGGTAETTQGGS